MIKKLLQNSTAPSFLRRNWQKLLALSLWVILLGGYAWYYISSNLTPLKAVQEIVDFLRTPYGPGLYILIYTFRPLIFFSTIVLTTTGGVVFGAGSALNFVLAVTYTVIGSNASCLLAYLIGRYFGTDILRNELDGPTNIVQAYINRLRRNSFETVMIMRSIFLAYDLVSYLCGFLRINWRAFLLATMLGSLPGTIAFTAFGASIDLSRLATEGLPPPNPWVFGFGILIFVVSIAISRYFKKREARIKENQIEQERINVLNTNVT